MTSNRRVVLFLLLVIFAILPASAQYKKQKAEKQMSGIVSSVEQANGMFTLRLANGDIVSAPTGQVRVRDMRATASAAKVTTDASNPTKARKMRASAHSVPVGSRVVVRRKLDKDDSLKRVVVRIISD